MLFAGSRIAYFFNELVLTTAIWAPSLETQEANLPPPPPIATFIEEEFPSTEEKPTLKSIDYLFEEPDLAPALPKQKFYIQAPAYSWAVMAPYFKRTLYSAEEHSYWNSQERLENLQIRYSGFADTIGEFSQVSFMPVREALLFVKNPLLKNRVHLSQEQLIHIALLEKMYSIPTGKALIDIAALPQNDMVIGVDNNTDYLGAFYRSHNAICYQLENTLDEKDKYSYYQSILTDDKIFSGVFKTFLEEVAHCTQHARGYLKSPTNIYRMDAKLWDLSVEAQAKLLTAVMYVEIARQEKDMKLFGACLTNTYLDEMIQKTVVIYMEEGAKTIHENPGLLIPVYASFLKSKECMNAYRNQASEQVNSPSRNMRVSSQLYFDTFGNLPGFKGNMFRDGVPADYSFSSIECIANLIPRDAELASWINSCRDAIANHQAEPRLIEVYRSASPDHELPPEPPLEPLAP